MPIPVPTASTALLLAAILATPVLATAETLTFETHGESVDGLDTDTGTLTAGVVTMTVVAACDSDPGATLMGTQSKKDPTIMGLGIKSTIDKNPNLNPGESLTVTFDVDVYLNTIDLGYVGSELDNSATFQIGDDAAITVYGTKKEGTVDPETQGVSFEGAEDVIAFEPKQALLPAGTPIRFTNRSESNKTYHLAAVSVEPADEPG